jgi:hypothetical protein
MSMKNRDMKDFKARSDEVVDAIVVWAILAILCLAGWYAHSAPEDENNLQTQECHFYDQEPFAMCGDEGVMVVLGGDRSILIEGATCN